MKQVLMDQCDTLPRHIFYIAAKTNCYKNGSNMDSSYGC